MQPCRGPTLPTKGKYRVDSRDSLIKGGNSKKAAVVPHFFPAEKTSCQA
jgi:hypothetical protein